MVAVIPGMTRNLRKGNGWVRQTLNQVQGDGLYFVCSGMKGRLKIAWVETSLPGMELNKRSESNFLFCDTAGLSARFTWVRTTKTIPILV